MCAQDFQAAGEINLLECPYRHLGLRNLHIHGIRDGIVGLKLWDSLESLGLGLLVA